MTVRAVRAPRAAGTGAMALAVTFAMLGAAVASAATLKGDYQFRDSLASSVAGAPTLTNLVGTGGPNAFATETVNGASARVLTFPKGNGVAMSSVRALLPSATYSVVLLVRLADVGGYRRYLDLTGGSSDSGFYNLNGALVLYPDATGSSLTPIAANAYRQVTVTRDAAGTVVGYVGATPALGPYDDSSTAAGALTTDAMRFFKDDDAVLSEDSAGAVSRIRVYEGALTAAEVAALAPPAPPPPPADGDGDGVRDSADACPAVPGATPDGCPTKALAPPVLARRVNVEPVRGDVFVSVPAGAARSGALARASATVPGIKGRKFVALREAKQIPVGSLLDTRKGTVKLTSAQNSRGVTQSSNFDSGVFQVLQSGKASAKGLTELRLKGASFSGCGAAKKSAARAAASKRKIRRLHGNGKGRFQTRGRYSAATVRGTDWTVTDRCDGTLTKVRRGTVTVRDLRRNKNITLKAGKSYLARAER